MTLTLLQLLSVLLVPMLVGAALLRLQGIGPRMDPLGWGSWCWLQGSVAVALFLTAWLWLGWPLRGSWIAAGLVGLSGGLFLLARRVPLVRNSRPVAGFQRWERACFALVLCVMLAVTLDRILVASNLAIVHSDEAYIWAAKAKALFVAGDHGPGFRAIMDSPTAFGHKDYPPLNPLLQVWVFAHAGGIVHIENRLPVQFFGLALVLAVASAVRRRARPLVAAAFLACMGLGGGSRLQLNHAFSDMLVAFGLFVVWDLWQRWEEEGEVVWLRLLATSSLLMVWSKNEGGLLAIAMLLGVLAAGAARRLRLPPPGQRRRLVLVALPALLSIAYLSWFNAHFGFENDLLAGSASGMGESAGFTERALQQGGARIGTILRHFASLMKGQHANYLVLTFLVCVLLAPSSAWAKGRMAMTIGLLIALLGYVGAYLGTHWEVQRHLDTSAHRLLYQLFPTAGLWLLILVVDTLPGTKSTEPEQNSSAIRNLRR